jgi:hypothetical protein
MKDKAQGFAIRKDRRDLQRLGGFLGSLFKVALLVAALGLYWRWHHDDPRLGPIFPSERKLVTANAAFFLSVLGLSGSAGLIAVELKLMRARPEIRLRKQATQIQLRKSKS